MGKIWKRVTALLLVLTLVMTCMPGNIFAAEWDDVAKIVYVKDGETVSGSELIGKIKEWHFSAGAASTFYLGDEKIDANSQYLLNVGQTYSYRTNKILIVGEIKGSFTVERYVGSAVDVYYPVDSLDALRGIGVEFTVTYTDTSSVQHSADGNDIARYEIFGTTYGGIQALEGTEVTVTATVKESLAQQYDLAPFTVGGNTSQAVNEDTQSVTFTVEAGKDYGISAISLVNTYSTVALSESSQQAVTSGAVESVTVIAGEQSLQITQDNVTDVLQNIPKNTLVTVTVQAANGNTAQVSVQDGNGNPVGNAPQSVTFTTSGTGTAYTLNVGTEYIRNTLTLDEQTKAWVQNGDIVVRVNGQVVTDTCYVDGAQEVTVSVEVMKTNVELEKLSVGGNSSETSSITFTTGKGMTYAVSVALITTDNIVTVEAENAQVTVNGETYTDTALVVHSGEQVVLTVKPDTNYKVTAVKVDGMPLTPNAQGEYTFVADKKSATYVVSVECQEVFCSLDISGVQGVTVTLKDNQLTTIEDLSKIPNNTEVTLTVKPEDGKFIQSVALTGVTVTPEWDMGTVSYTFTTGVEQNYVLTATTAPIGNASATATIDKYAVIGMHQGNTVKEAEVRQDLIDAAFGEGTNIEAEDVTMLYLAGNISLTIPIINETIQIPVNLAIDQTIPSTKDELVDLIYNVIGNNLITESMISAALGENWQNFVGQLHEFGSQDQEKVTLRFQGNDHVPSETVVVTAILVDQRKETQLDVNETITLPYGSYSDVDTILSAILEGKLGLTCEGQKVEGKELKLSLGAEDLVLHNVGEVTLQVIFGDDDLEYKGCSKDVTLKISKANVSVDVEDDFQIYTGTNTKEDFVTITPQLAQGLTDDVSHLYFVMGLDVLEQELVASLDLSKVYVADNAIEQAAIDAAVKAAIAVADPEGDGLSLSELADLAVALAEKLEGLELNFDTAVIDQVKAVLERVSQYAPIRVLLVYKSRDITPVNHGAYLMGVVTTDPNYNTAQDVSYLVISAEPVDVKFSGETLFTYDGTPKAVVANAYGQDGTVLDGVMAYRYVGLQSDGTMYNAQTAPSHTGVYTVLALYRDDVNAPVKFGFGVTTMVIQPSSDASVTVENKVHTYDGTSVDLMSMIQTHGPTVDLAYITAQINVTGDFSQDGFQAVGGNVNVDLPDSIDEVLQKYFPGIYDGVSVDEFVSLISDIQNKLAEVGVNAAVLDEVIHTLDKLSGAVSLTFRDISEIAPSSIGIYYVAAVVCDPNYVPASDAGILVIQPSLEEAQLSWKETDLNGVITYPSLQNRDMGAVCSNASLNDKIVYYYFGVDAQGMPVVVNDKAELTNGAWMQVAYVPAEVSANMYLVMPIARTFLVIPQNVEITFPNTDENNFTHRVYNGNPQMVEVTVKYADGTAANADYLTVTYTGVDFTGKVYNSTVAPTNAGVYTVTAVYLEETDGQTAYGGVAVGSLVIEPADASIQMEDTTVCYNPGVEQMPVIDAGVYDEMITIIRSQSGVNVVLPEGWMEGSVSLPVADAVARLESILSSLNEKIGDENVQKVIAELHKVLESVEVVNVTINGAKPVEIGEYTITVVGMNPNYKFATKTAKLTIMAHPYGEPVFNWSEDGKSCSVVFTCANNETHVVTLDAEITSEVKTPATNDEMGVTTYTATVTFQGEVYTDTKDVTDIPALGPTEPSTTEPEETTEATESTETTQPTETTKPATDPEGPDQTGDTTNLGLLVFLTLSSAACLAVVVDKSRKVRRG